MTAIDVHPSELAYAFSYARAEAIIGWGSAPFLPARPEDGDPADWLAAGETRMLAAGRLVGSSETGLNFTEAMTQAILVLVDPGIVLVAQRKAGDGLRTLTVHLRDGAAVGLTRQTDGQFALTRYDGLTAAAVACAAFVGATLAPADSRARIETDQATLSALNRDADAGDDDKAVAALMALGAAEPDARSAALVLAAPIAAGVVSVLYCAGNVVADAQTFSVMTNAQDHTWVVFPPASLDGPMVMERSSLSALAARVTVGMAARMAQPG